jgi:hypothetical protein
MDPRERINNLDETLIAVIKGNQTELWTALPAYVVSYDATAQTISAQPTISLQVSDQYNVTSTLNFPVILDIPVCFPGGGGFTLTFPVAEGDECLLIFASRCIDGWFAYGGIQTQVEPRMHDLSDGFAIIGPRSLPNALTGVSTSAVQLRADDGLAYVEIASNGSIAVTSPVSITLTAPTNTITANGNILG